MKILEIITLGEIGGAQNVLVDLVKGFTERFDAEVDVVFGEGNYLTEALPSNFRGEIIQLPYLKRSINLKNDIKTLLFLNRLCQNKNYDIVHCHSSKAAWLGRLAGRTAGIRRVCVTVHGLSYVSGDSPVKKLIYKNIERILLPLKSEYVFVSTDDMYGMNSLGVSQEKCKVIPNGRAVPTKPDKGLRELLGIDGAVPLVCMVGRLSFQKNPMLFIKIAQQVLQKWPKEQATPHFVLVGDGPLRQECQAYLNVEAITGNVHLTGDLENAGQYFWDTDIALLTSNYESCPLVIIEAMATGTPVVASNVIGTRHIINHGEDGYLFSLDQEGKAAEHIMQLLLDRELAENVGNKAKVSYGRKYVIERMVDDYADYFGLKPKSGEDIQ
ncbi:glycosyltransferase family 4 protein [Phosphitispora fastidiosa]|uniref:glycosyltransferase family 4 protein n=1 Tax=Phosphitispora fastidiosa TaxID=2837202 RepID=UPI001E3B1C41|nr:glycosyltransferase family 4 protein [Phosphitispora fastidiosa]MBU7008165.1 glycosyltransferase involved in cell wall biosynthesis [Phosphitispora fastidiosa]